MKTALITGAGGFIGSHLTEALVAQGWQVKALVHYNSRNHWGWLDGHQMGAALEVISGDIRDGDQVRQLATGCEVIFHLAALIAIPYSYHSPRSYVDTNVTGTLNVLQAARLHGCKVLQTSTSEVYGTAQYVPIDEKHPLQGQSPYSASKIGADMLAESFYRSFQLPVVVVRPFNTFGPRQSARAVIPTILSQLFSDKPHIEMGALTPTRDLNYVRNTVSAFITAAQHDAAIGQVLNFGSGQEISMGQLAEKLMALTGIQKPVVSTSERQRPANSEVERLCCDASKANQVLQWQPTYTFVEGLQETIAWFKEHHQLYKANMYVV